MKKTALVFLAILLPLIFISCASGPTSAEKVKLERQQRTYERYIKEHTAKNDKDLEKPGIYFYKNNFYVVIGVSDKGADSYPDLACNKLVSSLISYDILEENLISSEEYYDLVLKFKEAGYIEGDYTNTMQVKIAEKDIRKFRESYGK